MYIAFAVQTGRGGIGLHVTLCWENSHERRFFVLIPIVVCKEICSIIEKIECPNRCSTFQFNTFSAIKKNYWLCSLEEFKNKYRNYSTCYVKQIGSTAGEMLSEDSIRTAQFRDPTLKLVRTWKTNGTPPDKKDLFRASPILKSYARILDSIFINEDKHSYYNWWHIFVNEFAKEDWKFALIKCLTTIK